MTIKTPSLMLILMLFFSTTISRLNAGESDDLQQRIDAKRDVTNSMAVLFGIEGAKFSSINEWESVFKLGRSRADIEKQLFAAICNRKNHEAIYVSLDLETSSVRVSNRIKIGDVDIETSARLLLFFDSHGMLGKIKPSSSQEIRG